MNTERKDWRELLVEAFETGGEPCHGGCGDPSRVLRLKGKKIGAFCRGCWSEIGYGRIPKLDLPAGAKRRGSSRPASRLA